MGMGAVGPSPRFIWRLGLRVSSCGLWFFAFPPPFFFSEAPRPLRLLGPTLPWPTRLSPACSAFWCCRPIPWASIRSPWPALRLPLAGVAPLYSASPPHPLSCLTEQPGSQGSCVLGTERPIGDGSRVHIPLPLFIFRIYRGLSTPYGFDSDPVVPALRSLHPPSSPRFYPPIFFFAS